MKSLRAHIRAKSLALCRKTRDAAGVQRRWSLFVTEKAKFSTYDTPVWHRPKDECGGGSAWAAGFIHAFHFSSTPLVGSNQLRRADLLAALCQESAGDFSRVTAAELAAAEASFADKEARPRRRRRRGAGGGGARAGGGAARDRGDARAAVGGRAAILRAGGLRRRRWRDVELPSSAARRWR